MKIYEKLIIEIMINGIPDVLLASGDSWNPDIETPPIWEK